MNLNLPCDVEALIADRVRSGRYASPEAVVTAAMHALRAGELPGEFDPGEWDALIAAGQRGDVAFDGQSVLAVLKALRREAAIK
jgi:Arc/MetJ-type ribon-helix-helix transcriptional regulator